MSWILHRATRLQKPHLNYEKCGGITNSGLERLGQSLKKLTCLQTINFDFSECYIQVRDEALRLIGESIQDLTSLQDVTLDFTQ